LKKKILVIAIACLVATMMVPPLVPTAQARITEETHYGTPGEGYTEYYGTMGRANFYVLLPDVWSNPLGDGMLVMMCHSAAYAEDPRDDFSDYPFAMGLAMQGIAVAASNYGPADSGVEDGVIRTHQLTMYVIENYDVTGKVFLFGTSLGGCVALLLGERHPNVYSGVLDNSGIKDWAAMYYDAASYSGSDLFLLVWNAMSEARYEDNYGGTPEERPNKYAKYSPTHHADMAIPVISVVHVDDAIVSPTQTDLYHAALSDPSLHVIVEVTVNFPGPYPVFPGLPPFSSWYGHFDPNTYMTAETNLINLIIWSNSLDS
jgi:pimeloyl-ACP methyl ester carboxylesterase